MWRCARIGLWTAVLGILLPVAAARAGDEFTVPPGDSVRGELESSDDRHCVHLDLPAGTQLKAKLRTQSGEDLALRIAVRGPNCLPWGADAWLSEKSDGRKVTLKRFPVVTSGEWRLVARTGDYRTGGYELQTRPKYQKRFAAEGEVTAEAQEAAFVFSGPEGATVTLKVKGEEAGALLPRILEVRGPDGLPMTLPPATGTARKLKIKDIHLPMTGDYTVILTGADETRGSWSGRAKIKAATRPRVTHDYAGRRSGCCENGGGGTDPKKSTMSSSLIGPDLETVPFGTTEFHALTLALYAAESTTVSWLRFRNHGRDEDVRAVRVYWDNDRFYTPEDPGEQIAGGLVSFVNGSLDLNVETPLSAFAPRYVHVVLDLEDDLPVGRELGVRVPSGGVQISAGLWSSAARPPHDAGPILVVPPVTTYRWQDISKLAGDGATAGPGPLMVRADRSLILFPANETPFRNVYRLDLDFLGGGWRLVAAEGSLPPKRWGACGVYDAENDRLVMFGGRNGLDSSDVMLADVWALDFTLDPPKWRELTPTTGNVPVARVLASAVLDTKRQRMLVFGGHDSGSVVRSDVWAWDLSNDVWESGSALDVIGTVPFNGQGLTGHVAVYDSKHDRMVVTTGSPVNAQAREFTTMSTRTYVLELKDGSDANVWRSVVGDTGQPMTGRIQAVSTFDGVRMIVHGGAMKRLTTGLKDFLPDTWVLDLSEKTPGEWTKIRPGGDDDPRARAGHVIAWDPEFQSAFLYGGDTQGGDTRETWRLREEVK